MQDLIIFFTILIFLFLYVNDFKINFIGIINNIKKKKLTSPKIVLEFIKFLFNVFSIFLSLYFIYYTWKNIKYNDIFILYLSGILFNLLTLIFFYNKKEFRKKNEDINLISEILIYTVPLSWLSPFIAVFIVSISKFWKKIVIYIQNILNKILLKLIKKHQSFSPLMISILIPLLLFLINKSEENIYYYYYSGVIVYYLIYNYIIEKILNEDNKVELELISYFIIFSWGGILLSVIVLLFLKLINLTSKINKNYFINNIKYVKIKKAKKKIII